MNNTPLVSVCMITYGHEQFISQAIEGFLLQQTDFEVELIISNDASPDNTDEICRKYASKFKSIRYYKHDVNIGMVANVLYALKKCAGNYIAICEGDDYWTDPYKLQKQVDFLENNPEYSLCFHKVKIFEQKSNKYQDVTFTPPDTSNLSDLKKGNYIQTLSVVYRNNIQLKKLKLDSSIFPPDYVLHLIVASTGYIKYLDFEGAVYRIHEGGIHSTKKHSPVKFLPTYNWLARYFHNTHPKISRHFKLKAAAIDAVHNGILNYSDVTYLERLKRVFYGAIITRKPGIIFFLGIVLIFPKNSTRIHKVIYSK